MANAKISELPSATTPLAGTELAVIVQAGETRQVAVSQIGGGSSGFTAAVLPIAAAGGVFGGSFDVSVPAALTTDKIIATDADADDMDALVMSATCPADGTVRVSFIALPGPVAGDRNILLNFG